MKKLRKPTAKSKTKGMRQRWLLYTTISACAVGLVCVLLATALFAGNIYGQRKSELIHYADVSAAYFDDRVNKSETDFHEACMLYTRTCDTGLHLDLQFVDPDGLVISSSSGAMDGNFAVTPEITEAINSRGVCTFAGKDPATGQNSWKKLDLGHPSQPSVQGSCEIQKKQRYSDEEYSCQ